jgi:hypothetical protein
LAAAVIAGLKGEESRPDPAALARIDRDRSAATERYLRDRDSEALQATMRQLDCEESEAQANHSKGPTAAEAATFLADSPSLWHEAEASGRKLLAESLFERIEVLGAGRVHLLPSVTLRK